MLAVTFCRLDQPDFLTATKFINALVGTGVQVLRAKEPFEVAGKKYPAGSYIVKSGQAFRATCSTCSSRKIIPTISLIQGRRHTAL